MAYLKIGPVDFSNCVNELNVSKEANYNGQTNAAGDTVVDYINHKRVIEVGIVPIDAEKMASLLAEVDKFNVKLSFRNPQTNVLEENVDCIIPGSEVKYYTIQADKVLYKAFSLKFMEL